MAQCLFKEVLLLLRRLKRIPSQLCLKDRFNFHFAWNTGTSPEIPKTQVPCWHYLIVQQMVHLFTREPTPPAWDPSLLDQLLSRLDHYQEGLELLDEEAMSCTSLRIPVLHSFQGILHYLRAKPSSPCAWEVVREELAVRVVPQLLLLA
ncbi:interferon alpha-A-like [Tenrec ecaudatus]|uniref:interferon alpha-A-like n=1 Tax=Tenrec ecaudatus TaxID=94439 RepID=UPI003F5989A3